MRKQFKISRQAVFLLFIAISLRLVGQDTPANSTKLLDNLVGHWVLEGKLGAKQVTHEVIAEWILNHEYLRLHEVSHEKKRSGDPAYEAIIFFSWDDKTSEYRCLWLDNTDGRGLSVPIARGKNIEQSIQIEFPPPFESLHTQFRYDERADHWHLIIDDIKDGKPYRYGDAILRRVNRRSPD